MDQRVQVATCGSHVDTLDPLSSHVDLWLLTLHVVHGFYDKSWSSQIRGVGGAPLL
jgi:hypothetical protein